MKTLPRFFISICILSLLAGCASNHRLSADQMAIAELRAELISDPVPERENPFQTRMFDPRLEGRWIGQAISYGCYREGQAPGEAGPSKAQILEDLRIIVQHWNLIRVYNADDDTRRILEVIRENGLPLKMMLGIWLENETDRPETRESNLTNLVRGISLANEFKNIVTGINVGNETQVFWSGHRLASDTLTRYIRIVRKHVLVPVTTADDYNFWNKSESKDLAAEVDFIVTHIYPLWNGKTLDEAIPWLEATYDEVMRIHPNKQLVLGEIGWATAYNADKQGDGEQGSLIKGEVGLRAQERFLLDFDAWANAGQITHFWFEAFDEPWKGGGKATGTNEIEENWGLFYQDRTPKQSFHNFMARKGSNK